MTPTKSRARAKAPETTDLAAAAEADAAAVVLAADAETAATVLAADAGAGASDLAVGPAAGGPKPVLGVVLDINGQEVVLNSDAITDIQNKGFELGLTQPVYLGTFNDMIKYIQDNFNVTIPAADGLPPPFDTIIAKVQQLGVTIVKAHIKVPPKAATTETTKYTLVMSALWAKEANPPKVGPIAVTGFVFGVTNEPPPAPAAPAAPVTPPTKP